MYQLGWFPDFSDADNYLSPFFAKDNFVQNHYDDAAVQALLAQESAESDEDERADLIGQVQDAVAADPPTLPLLQGTQVAVAARTSRASTTARRVVQVPLRRTGCSRVSTTAPRARRDEGRLPTGGTPRVPEHTATKGTPTP